jgi:hypothetical protein
MGILALLTALRPVSEGFLAASKLLGARANMLARLLYGLGQLSGMVCISKPKFSDKYSPPPAAAAGDDESQGG